MVKDIKIEVFEERHIKNVLDILHHFNKENHVSFPEYFKSFTREEVEEQVKWYLEEESTYGYIAKKDDKIIGVVFFGIIAKPINFISPEVVYIYNAVVDPKYRSLGIGAELIKKVVGFCKTRGIEKIELEITNFNERGIEFYKKAGFYDYSRIMFMDVNN